jgi:hypothetical protein
MGWRSLDQFKDGNPSWQFVEMTSKVILLPIFNRGLLLQGWLPLKLRGGSQT